MHVRPEGYPDISEVLDYRVTRLSQVRQEAFGLSDATGQIALMFYVIDRQSVCKVLSDTVVVHDDAEALGLLPYG